MQQLVQLREQSETLAAHNAIVLVVFREESQGLRGLEIVRERIAANFILALDPNNEQTKPYGIGPPVFETFLIDPDGSVRAVLTGATYNRPTGEEIINKF